MKSKRLLIALLLLLAASTLAAQGSLNAPYSQYGIGNSRLPFNAPWAAALGGATATQPTSTAVNPFNPASYAQVRKESFVFDMGFLLDFSSLKDNNGTGRNKDGNLAYINLAFPITQWWKTAIGLLPYTSVTYLLSQPSTLNTGSTMYTRYEGYGGVNRFYWGNGFNLTPHLSVGLNINYHVGQITKAITYDFADTTRYFDSRRQKDTYVSNFTFDAGAQYRQPLGDKYTLNTGLVFVLPRTMKVHDAALAYTFVSQSSNELYLDTIFPVGGQSPEYTSTLEQPWEVTLGVALERNELWQVAADATFASWRGMKYVEDQSVNLFGNTSIIYDHNVRLALGAQWMGDKSASRYLRRISYSAGLHYEKGKTQFQLSSGDAHSIDEFGVGAGISFPMRKGRSALSIAFSYSSMGNIDLLRHNCFTIGISLGSVESWFVKRKYN